ncbi:MAG: flagellar hook-associated protein FlgL [Bacteriovoracaceae bacterium]
MSRVSENSSTHALNYSMGKTKSKLEDLHIKGSTLKKITKPSDDPVGNVQLLSIRSQNVDGEQYLRASNFATTSLEFTESALEDISELLLKAKELAIAQSSDIYNPEVRKNVSMEVSQIKKQALGIANRKLGNRYLFSGYSTLTRPFDNQGRYHGDKGSIQLEIGKDFFVPINLNGHEIFFGGTTAKQQSDNPLEGTVLENMRGDPKIESNPELNKEINKDATPVINRELASVDEKSPANAETESQNSIFGVLTKLEASLQTANPDAIQELLPEIDDAMSRIITLRTRIGSISQSINTSDGAIEKGKIFNEKQKSTIEDADVAELFTNIQKQQAILEATYKSGSQLINRSLLDFLR